MSKVKMTKQELRKMSFRWSWNRSLSWNYEKMMSLGYLTTLAPFLDRIYADDEEARQRSYAVHSQFFNTEPNFGNVILGMNVAIEEELGKDGIDTAQGVKTSLMGPFAGIGDTLFGVISSTILGSIAVATAVEGSYVGIALWIMWNIFVLFFLRPAMFTMGYNQGIKLVTNLSGQLKRFTNAASVLGLTVVGAMIASMVGVKFGAFEFFGTTFDIQAGIADKIMPKLGSALAVALFYYLLGRKGVNPNRLIWIVMIVTLVLSYMGILVTP
ncbi:MAG: PTS system mannose/fructose/sorbose family transporter subunit IID [Synergistaceae bacterium]|nr:PTS system mannose/fructose/sorbose family transporter subunit IID [Synergistaceae bacterium]